MSHPTPLPRFQLQFYKDAGCQDDTTALVAPSVVAAMINSKVSILVTSRLSPDKSTFTFESLF